ncbi:hypothetical protein HMPREF0591_1183 [Mycobacterium parascrofulaceum ATCC BAA-614]|uniref:Uncharacterized protein n=1 Tax=Mycobacterium parascrofulaceum ATCC BAA-614 TaxID=525368 RepID=D5P4T9_9MYCO|nr:hypothetical protein HMPREF0591_1183 [Mycobacterium parascrofulaceum ATCC BAA-614]
MALDAGGHAGVTLGAGGRRRRSTPAVTFEAGAAGAAVLASA